MKFFKIALFIKFTLIPKLSYASRPICKKGWHDPNI